MQALTLKCLHKDFFEHIYCKVSVYASLALQSLHNYDGFKHYSPHRWLIIHRYGARTCKFSCLWRAGSAWCGPHALSALYPQIGSTITEKIFYPNLQYATGISMTSYIVYSHFTVGE